VLVVLPFPHLGVASECARFSFRFNFKCSKSSSNSSGNSSSNKGQAPLLSRRQQQAITLTDAAASSASLPLSAASCRDFYL